MRKTKIVCTLGPATDDENILRELMLSGMNVARLNMSHQADAIFKERVKKVKKIRKELGLPVALLLDTKGPEIRIGSFSSSQIKLKKNQNFTLFTNNIVGDESGVSISYKSLPNEVKEGTKILIDDGLIELKVIKSKADSILCKVINPGILSSHKGINVPEINLSLPFISSKDKNDLKLAVEENFDFIAASFTRSSNDIIKLKNELKNYGNNQIKIIAKIENSQGVENIDDIIKVSDGIMVARGDLGVEVPIEEIPIIQKNLINKACENSKHVIIATQMLDSMIKQPRPTRAEVTDVANAIYDGASAIMLSAETAAGKYPVLSVKTMDKIAKRTEKEIDYKKRFLKNDKSSTITTASAISHATCSAAHELNTKSIITVTKSGRTAEFISKYRPNCPIIAGTTSETVLRQMNLLWGVIPILMTEIHSTDELFAHIVNAALNEKLVKNGDIVVITAGIPFGVSGTTNLLKIHEVNDQKTSN